MQIHQSEEMNETQLQNLQVNKSILEYILYVATEKGIIICYFQSELQSLNKENTHIKEKLLKVSRAFKVIRYNYFIKVL